MERISEFCYEENGLRIVFTELPKEAPHIESFYEFEVSGDTELTDKLRKAVMNKKVTYEFFFECANSLFEIIRSGDFEEVPTKERVDAVFAKFKELAIDDPRFMVKRISTHPPRSMVMLLNSNGLGAIKAEARNILTAKVKAIEEFIVRMEV